MLETENSKKEMLKRAIVLLFIFGFIAVLIVLIVWSKYKFGRGVICPFYALFNWHCPGCGGTRMAVSLLKGDFYQAFRYNQYVFITLPILFVVFIMQAYTYIRYNRLLKYIDKFLITYTALWIAFSILRNIELFSWLAPVTIPK